MRVERRPEYMAALEQASVHGNITDFARLLMQGMQASADFAAAAPVKRSRHRK